MKILNNTSSIQRFRTFAADKGQHHLFDFGPGSIPVWMDVNDLSLFWEEADVPLPSPSLFEPQFPYCPNKSLKHLILEVTHACPLRCDYCFVAHHYPEMQKSMTFDTAQLAIDRLYAHWDKKERVNIGFFGGEPLLCVPLMQQVVEYAKQKFNGLVGFGMTTNACLLTKESAAFVAGNFNSCIVSMDGPPTQHDFHRKYANGKGTFADVLRGITLLNDANFNSITLRGTFLPDRIRLVDSVSFLNSLAQQGMARNVSVEPANLSETACIDSSQHFGSVHREVLTKEYDEVVDWMVREYGQGRKPLFHNINVYVSRILQRKVSCSQCGAGIGYLSVSPSGDISACHREAFTKIGNIHQGGIDEKRRAYWVENRYYRFEECRICGLRNLCGGPCRENNIASTGDIDRISTAQCMFYEIWIRSAVKLLCRLSDEERNRLTPAAPSSLTITSQPKNRFAFVREAGGFGDIISMGGAAVQLKKKYPDRPIVFCIPNEFIEIAEHLEAVDTVIGLGPLEYLARNRRKRNHKMDTSQYPYLIAVPRDAEVVDLWCPALSYEVQEKGYLKYTRSQIFALTAGSQDVNAAIPRWLCTKDERLFANKWLGAHTDSKKPILGFAPRGTDTSRCMPQEFIRSALQLLAREHNILYLDCVEPDLDGLVDVYWPNTSFCKSAALVEQCDALISVDTSIFHLGTALRVPTLGVFTSTDATPYHQLYPHTQYYLPSGRCAKPCNRNPDKSLSTDCNLDCTRKSNLNITLFEMALGRFLKMARSSQIRQARMDLLVST